MTSAVVAALLAGAVAAAPVGRSLTLAGLATTTAQAAGAAGNGDVRFSTREEGGGFVVAGTNAHPALPYHVTVTFPALDNLRPSLAPPARLVLPAAATRDLVTLVRVDDRRRTNMRVSYRYGKGDPGAVPDPAARFLFPWEHGTKHTVDQGYFGRTTHQGESALDFNLPEGTVICAAREGIVIGTKSDSTRGGPEARFEPWSNYVDVLHPDGTWANYAHLKPGGVLVKTGEQVAAGQAIGLSGRTGRASGPHLHFAVYKASWSREGGETVPTLFAHLEGEAVSPVEGRTYYAVHPGGAAFTPKLGERLRDEELAAASRTIAASGKVEVRSQQVDEKTLLWCANGMNAAQAVTVSFTRLAGLVPSKKVPYTVTVPARTEVFLFTLVRVPGTGASYEVSWSWKPAGRSSRKRAPGTGAAASPL